jgi:hypothetical protein
LGRLDLDPSDPGAAPTILEPTFDPTEIPIDGSLAATVQASLETDGTLHAFGVVSLHNGIYDINVGRGAFLRDDGQSGDPTAGDGLFTYPYYGYAPVEVREDDEGPRLLRFQAEVETADGFRHAVAIEVGPLEVVAAR